MVANHGRYDDPLCWSIPIANGMTILTSSIMLTESSKLAGVAGPATRSAFVATSDFATTSLAAGFVIVVGLLIIAPKVIPASR
ncbi:MAG TPA: hypothetical protein VMS08_03290 [Candidatus Saccharimonadia bacterium]|nr:hypothetical protein [Candidatus Saccharimonadia bacterium]